MSAEKSDSRLKGSDRGKWPPSKGADYREKYLPTDDGAVWHALTEMEVLDRLDAERAGLDETEAARRLVEHGPNSLPPTTTVHPFVRFLAQFNNALIYFLLAATDLCGMRAICADTDQSALNEEEPTSVNGILSPARRKRSLHRRSKTPNLR